MHPLNRCRETIDEASARKVRRMSAQLLAIPLTRLDFVEGPAKRLYHRGVEKNSGLSVDHRVQRPSLAERHDRRAEGHGFERSDPEVLDARKDEALRIRQPVDDPCSFYGAEELDVWGSAGRETVEERPTTDDHKLLARCL